MKKETAVQKAVRVLNDLFEHEKDAVQSMLCYNVPTNDTQFAEEHPTIQFGVNPTTGNNKLSFLGLINGIVSEQNGLMVATKWNDVPDSNGCYTLLGFCEIDPFVNPYVKED